MELENTSIIVPQQTLSYDEFTKITQSNIEQVFGMKSIDEQMSRDFFVHNSDHGLEHEYNVYTRAIQIAQDYEYITWSTLRMHLLYPMAICHDAMRSIKYPESDPQKLRKEKRNDTNHQRYGALFYKKIMHNNLSISISDNDQTDTVDYLYNHDFFSHQLNGKRYREPASIEWQIVRLADRTSVPICDEIQRYRDTWIRLGTPLFCRHMPLDHRTNFSFDTMWLYAKNGWIDEMWFFIALLMITSKDFEDPLLGQRYDERATQKSAAVLYIKNIAQQSDPETYTAICALLDHLWPKFNFT